MCISRFYFDWDTNFGIMKITLDENTTGVILVGGRNNRMGANKALLKIDGKTFIERSVDLMESIFKENLLCTNNSEGLEFLDIQKIENFYPDFGPLAGIHSALNCSCTEKIFVIPCHMPFLTQSIIKHLINIITMESIVLPSVGENVQYLCGIYHKNILPVLDNVLTAVNEAIKNNKDVKKSAFSVWNFVERIGAEVIDVELERFYFNDMFFEVNTTEDYEYVLDRL